MVCSILVVVELSYLTSMNTGGEGLLTAPLLSVTVRLNAKVLDACGAINIGLRPIMGSSPNSKRGKFCLMTSKTIEGNEYVKLKMHYRSCSAILHYHTRGMTCRNCGLCLDHELLLQECDHLLEEAEKTTSICVFCLYDIYIHKCFFCTIIILRRIILVIMVTDVDGQKCQEVVRYVP